MKGDLNGGDMEDAVCRAANAATLALMAFENIPVRDDDIAHLTREDREVLYFIIAETRDLAAGAKDTFYEVLRRERVK